MPILADLSRRFHLLTTDAKPDPPRINIRDNSYNNSSEINSSETSSASSVTANTSPAGDNSIDLLRNKEEINSSGGASTFSTSAEDTGTKPISGTKKKNHSGQPKNIVNYNIINSSRVKIGETTTYVCNINQYGKNHKATQDESNPTTKPTAEAMPESVKKLSISKDELTIRDMFIIKTHIDNNWRAIFTSLGYSKGQLDQFEETHKLKGMDEIFYQILLDWKRENGTEAHIGAIVTSLWQHYQYECVKRLLATNNKS